MKTMASKSIWNLAFLTLFALSPPHQSSAAASRGRFLLNPGAPPPEGLCSATVKKHGYKCKEFHVTTGDGYILSLNRIPEGRAGGGKRRRPPVLLQHGVLLDGMAWLAGPPKQSLAMLLADKGFDVWISNLRGTRFSRRHTRLDPIDPKFWNWTWDDLASQDLPSIIGFIFKKTGSKIHYVGHSMGTLIALASLSEGKLKNIKSAALLSPIAHLSHIESDIVVLAAKSFLGEWGRMFGLAEFDPIGQNEAAFLKDICEYYKVDCDQMKITALTGENCCLNGSTFNDIITKLFDLGNFQNTTMPIQKKT